MNCMCRMYTFAFFKPAENLHRLCFGSFFNRPIIETFTFKPMSSFGCQSIGVHMECIGSTEAGRALGCYKSSFAGGVPSERIRRRQSCARDPQCFNGTYLCESCCSSGISFGQQCWTGAYNAARCCNQANAFSTPAPLMPCTQSHHSAEHHGPNSVYDLKEYSRTTIGVLDNTNERIAFAASGHTGASRTNICNGTAPRPVALSLPAPGDF